MSSLDEGQLLERLKEVHDSAEQAALLSDLGNLHLAEGRVQEGEQCFRRAVAAQHAAGDDITVTEPSAGSDAEDDWETEWEQNLGQITPPSEKQPITDDAVVQRTIRRKGEPLVHCSRGAACRQRAESPGNAGLENLEVPFDGRHILEFHGLTSTDTATDLEAFLADISSGPIYPVVRWVNEKTALAVFSNPAAAQFAFQAPKGSYRLRLYSEACDASKGMPPAELQPPRPRPKTSAVVARRLIGMTLNAPKVRDKAAEEELRQQRQDHKELRRERQKQVDATWDG